MIDIERLDAVADNMEGTHWGDGSAGFIHEAAAELRRIYDAAGPGVDVVEVLERLRRPQFVWIVTASDGCFICAANSMETAQSWADAYADKLLGLGVHDGATVTCQPVATRAAAEAGAGKARE